MVHAALDPEALGITVPEPSRAALTLTPAGDTLAHYDCVYVFPDGSYTPGGDGLPSTAGWGFCAVATLAGEFRFLGVFGHSFRGSAAAADALEPHSLTAEVLGAMWGAIWASHLDTDCIALMPDNDTVIRIIEHAAAPPEAGGLPGLLFAVCGRIRVGHGLTTAHVKGHSGHPWNELADAVAKWAAVTGGVALPDGAAGCLLDGPADDWAWCHRLQGSAACAFPEVLDGCLRSEPARCRTSWPYPQSEPDQRVKRARLRLVTYNALSMVEDTARGFTERPALIRAQLHAMRPTFVGIQEARCGRLCKLSGPFLVVSSQAQHNALGCQLWINADPAALPYGRAISARHLAVRVSEPRILAVTIDNGAFRAFVVVVHAPGSRTPLEDRKAWWRRLTGVISDAKAEVILLADANARLGSCTSEHVGPGGFPERQDDSGDLFHQLLAETSLFLPATFCEVDASHATRAQHRIDYVAVPLAWAHTVASAFTGRDFDTLVRCEDHYPVIIDCETVMAAGRLSGHRKPAFDPAKVADPAAVADFVARLRATPAIPWSVPVDLHAEMLCDAILAAAAAAFPRDRARRPFKPYISCLTLRVVAFRKMLQRYLRRARACNCEQFRWAATRAAFCVGLDGFEDFGPLTFSCSSLRALTLAAHRPHEWVQAMVEHLRLTHCLVGDLVRADRVAFLEGIAGGFGPAMSAGAGRKAWRAVRVILAHGGKSWARGGAHPERRGPDGTVASDPADIARIMLDHFAGVECATVCEPDVVARSHGERPPPAYGLSWRNIDNVMPKRTLQRYFATAKPRAAGPDGVSGVLLRAAPAAATEVVYPLLMKCQLHGEEPLGFKGGVAVDIPKKVKDASLAVAYRSILLANDITKHHHRWLRSRLVLLMGHFIKDTQCAGVPRRGTDLASLLMKGFDQLAARQRRSPAKLFVDVRNAYYSTIRQFLVSIPMDDEQKEDFLDTLPIPVALERMVAAALDRPGLLDEHIDDEHFRAIFADLNRDTWFYMQGCGGVAATSRGTGPGGPLADILFAVSQTPILDDIESQLKDMGALLCIPPLGNPLFSRAGEEVAPVFPSDATLADDVVLLTVLPQSASPEAVTLFLQQVVRITDTAFRSRGYTLNYDDGKSGLMVSPTGKYARRIKQLLYLHFAGRLPVPGAVRSIKIDSAYKHLGTVATRRLTMDAEVAARAACARTALAPLRKAALRLEGLSMKHKLLLTDACATSILFFHCGAWPPLSGTQRARMEATYAQLLAAATGLGKRSAREHSSHSEIWIRAHRFDADTFIRIARLRMLHRIVSSGPAVVRRMVDFMLPLRGTWGNTVADDIAWAQSLLGRDLAPTAATLVGAVRLAADGAAWGSFCRKVRAAATWHHIDGCKLALWHKELPGCAPDGFHGASEHGDMRDGDDDGSDQDMTPVFCCYDCDSAFDTVKGLNVHRRRAHGVRRPARRYAEGGTCRSCGVMLHTRPRLIQHLNHGLGGCLAKYIAFAEPLSEQRIAELDANDRERRRSLAGAGLRETHAEAPALSRAACPCWPGLPGPEAVAEASPVRPAAIAVERPRVYLPPPTAGLVPGVPLLVLHLFSGQRRESDFQFFMEAEAARLSLPLLTLSLDVVNDPFLGDLTRKEAQAFWLGLLRAGRVAIVMAGPPCETWSAARHNPGEPGDPRPVRSLEHLWGVPGLTSKEARAVALGNDLLRFTLLLLHAAVGTQTVVIMEHPEERPRRQGIPSSAFLPEMVALRARSGAGRVCIDQACFGAISRKPTTLTFVNCDALPDTVYARADRGRAPASWRGESLMGRSADGGWKTAPAKQYPPGLCHLLASAAATQVARLLPDFERPSAAPLCTVPAELADSWPEVAHFYLPLDPYCEAHQWGQFGLDCPAARRD